MNEVMMLRGAEPRKILESVINEGADGVMSYLSRGKWHVAKVNLSSLGANRFDVELVSSGKKHPICVQMGQEVGLSIKFGYGKFIFETRILSLEPSISPNGGGMIVLAVPDNIELIQRRSYFRVNVPDSLEVNVNVWHRDKLKQKFNAGHTWHGKLADISAGGLQLAISADQRPDFKEGQTVGIRFTPAPYETPIMFNCQIRNVFSSADQQHVCIGMQVVGLETSPEGRMVLQRLCNVVERYYQINQSNIRCQDVQTSHF